MPYSHRLHVLAIAFGLALFALEATGTAEPKKPQITKSSSEKRFDAREEIKAFYTQLLRENASVKRQFDLLTKNPKDENGGAVFAFDPQVVEWFPGEDHWNVSSGFDSDDHYLVIQPVGAAMSRESGSDAAVVSLFRVQHTGTTKYDEKDEAAGKEPTLISNKITITFLGFQHLSVKPVSQAK